MEFQVFNENYESGVLAWWQFLPCGGHQTNFDICTMLNLMSNSFFFEKLVKLHENLVEIHRV
jgi:hypothetical protein